MLAALPVVGLGAAGAVATSALLLRVPPRYLPWIAPQDSAPPPHGPVVAHRGSRQEGLPENTLAAFQHAVASGADVIELDVWMTSDGQIIVHHDRTLSRMTSGADDRDVTAIPYASFPAVLSPPADQLTRAVPDGAPPPRVPLLSEVLDVLPGHVGLNVEVKHHSAELVDRLHGLLSSYGRIPGDAGTTPCYWFSLSEETNALLRARDASIPRIVSERAVLGIVLAYFLGVLPLLPTVGGGVSCFGLPAMGTDVASLRSIKTFKKLPAPLVWALSFALTSSGGKDGLWLPPALAAHLRGRGMQVWALFVNDEAPARYAAAAGATGVLTDRPEWLAELVRSGELNFSEVPGEPAGDH